MTDPTTGGDRIDPEPAGAPGRVDQTQSPAEPRSSEVVARDPGLIEAAAGDPGLTDPGTAGPARGTIPAAPSAALATIDPAILAASRRRLLMESLGIAVSAIGFGFVYGLAARDAGFSPIEAMAMSLFVFAGAAQFAAVGYVASGLAWPGVVLLTALLNARHLLYSAALAPWMREVPFVRRVVAAQLLTDEAFALSIGHFRRVGATDERGYWIGAIASTLIPWNLATLAGVLLGGQIPEPSRFGIDIIFPAAMIGLAVGLITGRRELVAAIVGAGIGVVMALVTSPSVGIVVGGVLGPLVGLLVPARVAPERAPLGTPASAERYSLPRAHLPRDERDGDAP